MRKHLLVPVVVLAHGCVFDDVHIPMTIPQDETLTGYLSDVASRDFTAVKIIDAREDRTRIGFRRNGFGQETADILSDEPVEIVVQRAVETMLANNGHKLADSGIQVTGAISAFWIEQDWNYYDTEFIARIECELVFSIQHDELYRKRIFRILQSQKLPCGQRQALANRNERGPDIPGRRHCLRHRIGNSTESTNGRMTNSSDRSWRR